MAKRRVASRSHLVGECLANDRDRFRFLRIATIEVAPLQQR